MSTPHDGHRERMRQRILTEGLQNLAPHEVLEYCLFSFVPRRNTNDIAHRLLARFGSLSGVLEADYNALTEVAGMTANAALFLSQLPTLLSMYKRDKATTTPVFIHPGDGAAYCNDLFGDSPVERCAALCLDVKGNLLSTVFFTTNQRDGVSLDMRKLIKELLLVRASAVIVAHNHPSGDVTPSAQDYDVYRSLQNALQPLQIVLLDCLIVGGGNAFSLMPKPGKSTYLGFAETHDAAAGEGELVGAGEPLEDMEYQLLFNRNNINRN